MTRTWSLSEEIYRSFHRWPIMIAFFGVGCLLGWCASFLWPASYRSTANIYVALNPYRAFNDSNFLALSRPEYSNLDDYKNWQMSQLMSAIFQQEFIQETLNRLQDQDQYWKSVDLQGLRSMLSTNWRSAGKWSLVAENKQARRVDQAVQTWREVILERVGFAVQASRQTILSDEALQAVIQKQADIKTRISELQAAQAAINKWQTELAGLPQDQPLEATQRWQILSLVSSQAKFTPAWTSLLAKQPSPTTTSGEAIQWLAEAINNMQGEMTAIQGSLQQLANEQSGLEVQFNQQSKKSLGLSPNLELSSLDQVGTEKIHPQSLFALTGGILGLLTWLVIELVRITKREKNIEQAES